nr:uncharacterized protein LOC112016320 [Quercus suber]
MWLSHLEFPNIVRDAWNNPIVLANAMTKFAEKARVWNKEVFGNLFHRKKRVVARLRGVQVALSTNPNNFLVDLERNLTLEFVKISKLKEKLWAMKSQLSGLVEGYRNTSFYHSLVLVRKRRNRIICMKDRAGNWIQGENEIVEFIRNGYVTLFSSSHSHSTLAKWDPPYWQTYLKEEDSATLTRSVSNEDILASLWSLKAFKAPGLDGLHASFFQHF